MIKKLRTELIYFFVILLILAVIQHSDLLSAPMARVDLMLEKQNYLHPLLWTMPAYIVVGIFRAIVRYILFLKNRNVK